jgi:predicted nucleic acid-binding protein
MSADDHALTFVDSNILVYAHDRDAGARHDAAAAALRRLWQNHSGALSTQVLQEFYVNVTRKVSSPLDRSSARAILAEYGTWTVHPLTVGDVLEASVLEEEEQLHFWDALIVVAAQRTGAEVLLSEDLQDGRRYGELTVRNPFL